MTTEVLRQQMLRITEGDTTWVLRYWLCRESTVGGGRTFFVRAHAQAWHGGELVGEALEITGGVGVEPGVAQRTFAAIVAGRVFPEHLRDVVRDLTAYTGGPAYRPRLTPFRLRALRK